MQSKRLGRRIRVYDVRARTTHYKRTDREVEEIENRETAREREREREREKERERESVWRLYIQTLEHLILHTITVGRWKEKRREALARTKF